jgi:hypothetical protein
MGLLLINDGGFKGFKPLAEAKPFVSPVSWRFIPPLSRQAINRRQKDFLPSVHMHRNFATIVLNDFVCGRPGHN